jgi:hypothetical protein
MKAVAAALSIAVMTVWAGAAKADHFMGSCANELNAVETAIQAGVFLGQNAATDQSNLLAKLEAAGAKIQLGKAADAVDKLQDISDKATALAEAPKPKLADATVINAAVTAAIACVGTLQP